MSRTKQHTQASSPTQISQLACLPALQKPYLSTMVDERTPAKKAQCAKVCKGVLVGLSSIDLILVALDYAMFPRKHTVKYVYGSLFLQVGVFVLSIIIAAVIPDPRTRSHDWTITSFVVKMVTMAMALAVFVLLFFQADLTDPIGYKNGERLYSYQDDNGIGLSWSGSCMNLLIMYVVLGRSG
jgi:hypothetical protein